MKLKYSARWLLTVAVIAFAGRDFGALGVVVFGILMIAIDRWPRAQIVTGSILTPVLFVFAMVFYQPSPTPAAAAPPAGVASDDWNTAALAFEAGHPDLKLGHNTVIMQRAILSLDEGQSPAQLLQDAYSAAEQDYSWVPSQPVKLDVADPFASANLPATSPPPEAARPASTYLEVTTAAAGRCISQGGTPASCWVEASPRRCTQQAVALLANPGENRRTWAMCVQSCADAGVSSQWFGDCHRESF